MVMLIILKERLIYKPQVLAITLSLVIALGLFLQSLDLDFFLHNISLLSSIPNAFADHGEEIVLSLNDTSFAQKSPEEGNQVKAIVNYATQDPMAVRDLVKGVMKVYSPNGTLLKTSSSPTPFPASTSGIAQLATTLTDNSQDSVTAKIMFTNPIRTEAVSNELLVKIDLVKGIAPASPDENQIKTEAVQDEKPVVTSPIPAEDAEVTEQPPVVPPQEEQQPITPTGPLFPGAPQTFTSETATPSVREICGDGLDNDADALTDFKDRDCLAITSPSTQLSQEEQLTAAASVEVCDDALDNDLDAKIDSEDEECISTAPLNQQLESKSQEGQESENSNNEEQPQSDEDDNNEDEDDNNEDEDDNNEDEDDNNEDEDDNNED
jgi:hypothetical protein